MPRQLRQVCLVAFVFPLLVGACARGENAHLATSTLVTGGRSASGVTGGRYGEGSHIRREDLANGELNGPSGGAVYFASDSSELTPDARHTLDGQARWIGRHPDIAITIEGHADERGTREYNIGLGTKRAAAVRSYLVGRGVPAPRIRIVSFGKERPVATCDDISCWSRNRRAQTIVRRAFAEGR